MNVHLFYRKLFGLVGLCMMLFLCAPLQAQVENGIEQGIFRIKVSPEMARQIESTTLFKDSNGIARTGLSRLDRLNQEFRTSDMKRTFRHAGKFENKHRAHGLHLWYDVIIDKDQNEEVAVRSYSELPDVQIAEPCLKVSLGVERNDDQSLLVEDPLGEAPNDPSFPIQWHYNNTGQGGGKPGADISLLKAWEDQTGSPDIIVSVVDGGIDVDHEDLAANMWINADEIPGNGIDDDNNGYIDDINGYGFATNTPDFPGDSHGTHVGGTVAAVTNNGIGMSGVAGGSGSGTDGVRMMSCATFIEGNVGGFPEAVAYGADNGAVISQNSWGYTQEGDFEQALLDAIDYFTTEAGYDADGNPFGPMQGGIVIFAAGNSGAFGEWYPGYYEPTFAVSGSDRNDEIYISSNRGDWVEIAAPAVQVQSTLPGNRYGSITGTSMACPHVSGVAALIVSKYAGSITPEEVRHRLISTVDKVATLPDSFGAGRLNAFRALQDDDGISPDSVTDLSVVESGQNTISLTWTAPRDEGNGSASIYDIRYSKAPISSVNFDGAIQVVPTKPAQGAGTIEELTVADLDPSTTYYFALKAIDVFGNVSAISNVVMGTTEAAPIIAITPTSLDMTIDVTVNPIRSESLSISNSGEGADLDFIGSVLSFDAATSSKLLYPGKGLTTIDQRVYGQGNASDQPEKSVAGTSKQVFGSRFASNIDAIDSVYYDSGDETAENFAGLNGGPYTTAIRYEVGQPTFTFTHYKNFLRTETLTSALMIFEVYKGDDIATAQLLTAQEENLISEEGEFFVVELASPQTFMEGDVFWVVTKYPDGISFPQGVDEGFSQRPDTFFFSSDGGASFGASGFVFKQRALNADNSGNIVNWVSLDPALGTVVPGATEIVEATFDATSVINGTYDLILRFSSNDIENPTVDIPTTVTVSGQPSKLALGTTLLEFGSVFVGAEKTLDMDIINEGLGDLVVDSIYTTLSSFSVDSEASTIEPGKEGSISVTFNADIAGNSNGKLIIVTNGGTLEVLLVGIGVLPPVLEVDSDVVIDTLDAGDIRTRTMIIGNSGDYPLTFSFPELAAKNLLARQDIQKNDVSIIKKLDTNHQKGSEIAANGHSVVLGAGEDLDYGYTWIDSEEIGGPVFVWNDIKETGTEILENVDDGFEEIDLPFTFVFYGDNKRSVKISSNGYLTFGDDGGDFSNDQIPTDLDPNDMIAPFWDDLRPSERRGRIFYQNLNDNFVVQYDSIGTYSGEGHATFQVMITRHGGITFYYKEMSGLSVSTSATVGIENSDGSDGAQVVFNSELVKDDYAVTITPPQPDFISTVSPLSGVIPVGGEKEIEVTLDATSINDGTYFNELLISSNDPTNSPAIVPFNLTVLGQAGIIVSPDTLSFDSLLLSLDQKKSFYIKNSGTKVMMVSNISGSNSDFIYNFEGPAVLSPGDSVVVEVFFAPSVAGLIEGILSIESDATDDEVTLFLSGVGLEPPVIAVAPDSIVATAMANTIVMDTLEITNNGFSELTYSIAAPYWFDVNAPRTASNTDHIISYEPLLNKMDKDTRSGHPVLFGGGNDGSFGYTWEDNKDGAGPVYDFEDIQTSGTNITSILTNGTFADGSVKVPLGFGFDFYGNNYDSVNISANGVLFFGNQTNTTFSNKQIPEDSDLNNLIAGFWNDLEPGLPSGTVHFANTPEYFVVQYTDVPAFNVTGAGITFQVLLFPDGKIKMMYEDVSKALFLESGTVGIEGEDGTDGIQVVFNNTYLEDKLAILFQGPPTGTIASGTTALIPIELNATGLIDGVYKGEINVNSNDPVTPTVSIPTTFTVIGVPEVVVDKEGIDFGKVFVAPDSSFTMSEVITISNEGSLSATIDSVYVSGDAFTIESFSAPLVLAPKQDTTFTLTFSPDSPDKFVEELVIETVGSESFVLSLVGEGITPPKFSIETESDTIYAKVRLNGNIRGNTIKVLNAGGADLIFDTEVIPLSKRQSAALNENTPAFGEALPGQKITRSNATVRQAVHLFNEDVEFADSIAYEDESIADDFVGIQATDLALVSATKFVAPVNGFSLSYVRNFVKTEGSTDAITMKVYVGGTVPTQGELVLEQSYTGSSSTGAFDLIELEELKVFGPGETFWVVFKYPTSIVFPQGFQENMSDVEGLYYYSNDDEASWIPIENDLPNIAFKVRAMSIGGAGWIELTPESGEVAAGSDGTIDVLLDAEGLAPGEYLASINVNSNDPFNPKASVPVKLQVNAPPVFVEVPGDTVEIDENELLELRFQAEDSDGKVVSYAIEEEYENSFFSAFARPPFLRFRPDYEQSGFYNFTIFAVDDFGDETALDFVVKVNDVNRDPIITKQLQWDRVTETSGTKFIDLSEFLTDPDGDELTYTVSASDPEVLDMVVMGSTLEYTPLKSGFVFVSIVAEDGKGGIAGTSTAVLVREANRSPEVIRTESDKVLESQSNTIVVDLSTYFSDPDEGDVLSYSVTTTDGEIAIAKIHGNMLEITHVDVGNADFMVTASDIEGAKVSTTFTSKVATLIEDTGDDRTKLMNYPNPYTSETTIGYQVEAEGHVLLQVLGSNGQLLETLVDEKQSEGAKEVTFYNRSLPVGTYLYRLEIDGKVSLKRMIRE